MTREELLKVAKPILFNTDMVQAILDGRKTVTRRVIKPQPKFRLCYTFAGFNHRKWSYPKDSAFVHWGEEYRLPDCITDDDKKMVWNPPYHGDDILYVRETWCKNKNFDEFYYRANRGNGINAPYGLQWKPSIHMPREAARIFMKVTNVRAERLHDIADEQAEKEGCNDYSSTALGFCYLWDSTIKKPDRDRYGWEANPWVWVIEFERVIPDV